MTINTDYSDPEIDDPYKHYVNVSYFSTYLCFDNEFLVLHLPNSNIIHPLRKKIRITVCTFVSFHPGSCMRDFLQDVNIARVELWEGLRCF